MKNERGITLTSLVITIIVLIILASVSINVDMSSLGIARIQNFSAKLTIIQEAVDNIVTEGVDTSSFTSASGNSQFTEMFNTIRLVRNNISNYQSIKNRDDVQKYGTLVQSIINSKSWNKDSDELLDNYYIFTPETLRTQLGIKDMDVTVIINFETRNVILADGVKYEGIYYYRLYDLNGAVSLKN